MVDLSDLGRHGLLLAVNNTLAHDVDGGVQGGGHEAAAVEAGEVELDVLVVEVHVDVLHGQLLLVVVVVHHGDKGVGVQLYSLDKDAKRPLAFKRYESDRGSLEIAQFSSARFHEFFRLRLKCSVQKGSGRFP